MKKRNKKIKTEHHILSEFHITIQIMARFPIIQKIIPGRINRQQKWSSHTAMTYSYDTPSGLKYIIKKWSTAQEIFIVCKTQDREQVKEKIADLIQQS